MKASLVLVLACVALAAATTRFERKYNQQHQYDNSQDVTYLNREFNKEGIDYMYQDKYNEYNQKYNRHDCTKMRNMHKPQCQSYYSALNQLKYNNNNQLNIHENNDNTEQYESYNNYREWNQFGRSSEETESNEQSNEYFEQYVRENDATVGTTNQYLKNTVDKIYSLYRIFFSDVKQSYENVATLSFDNTVPLEMTVYKPDKDHFIRFHDAQIRNMNQGKIEYLAVNPEYDNIYVEYQFDNLKTQGLYKSNLHHLNSGEFNIAMKNVYSNVSARFHSRRASIVPAEYEVAEVTVYDEQGKETEQLNEVLERKYLRDLERAISNEVFSATHKGMLFQLKTEITRPIEKSAVFGIGKLESMKWKENNVAMEMNNLQSNDNYSNYVNQKISAMSYTRLNNQQYKMRFDSKIYGTQWNGDFVIVVNGQRYQAQNVNFNLKNIEFEVNVFKFYNSDECRMVNTDVYLQGLQYSGLKEQLPVVVFQEVEQKLYRFIKHYLEAHMQKALKNVFCNFKKW
ncbi:putative uncharacterized protein DDB_G0287457 [Daktulosphaira vitifoliae]|uniref:putative uncharacterized protein DDB_G0287457 n=1 Tax=Daktulosphaira vitifoliae TaxID=58002 RepID=UPI0021A9EA41|nr:putative uncharacterized protein DDB_G0287457 [Daktulosphaira vitifoliae]